MAKIVGWIQMLLMMMVIAGETICKAIGIPVPEIVKKLQESPWLYGFLIFMLGNNIQNSLNTTGAFEVYVDGELIHSKLATGKMPNMEMLTHKFAEHGVYLQ